MFRLCNHNKMVIRCDFITETMEGEFSRNCPNTRLLILLLEYGKILRSSIQRKYGFNYRSGVTAFDYLEKLGLTLYEAKGDRLDTVYWSLTEKGMEVAERLKELDEYIRQKE
jgi:hypothetical protein